MQVKKALKVIKESVSSKDVSLVNDMRKATGISSQEAKDLLDAIRSAATEMIKKLNKGVINES